MRNQRSTKQRSLVLWTASVLLCGISSQAQVLEHKRPTELLVKQYENYVARGGLLTKEGWTRASKFFAKSDPYPESSDITIISAPGIIGETRVDGDHAEVGTKWGDYFGVIDSNLRFKPEPLGSVMLGEAFSLVYLRPDSKGNAKEESSSGEWKIERTPRNRAASIPSAIDYLERMRDQSTDPGLRKNAEKSIAALKRLTSGCGSASAC